MLSKVKMSKAEEDFSEFDWIQLNKDVRDGMSQETTKERMIRKIKSNPFVPIGKLGYGNVIRQ